MFLKDIYNGGGGGSHDWDLFKYEVMGGLEVEEEFSTTVRT